MSIVIYIFQIHSFAVAKTNQKKMEISRKVVEANNDGVDRLSEKSNCDQPGVTNVLL